MTAPATIIGTLTEEVQKITGLNAVPVIAVAGHDTASAVAAVPAKNEKFAYLSYGTWSLMGIETQKAIINEHSYELNFTNEGGIEGTTRFLKNICGMWIYERCRKEWKDAAAANNSDRTCLGHGELIAEAMKQPAFRVSSILTIPSLPTHPAWLRLSSNIVKRPVSMYLRATASSAAASSKVLPSATVRYSHGSKNLQISISTCSTSSVAVLSTNTSTSLQPTVVA